jgi:hypothetical protein
MGVGLSFTMIADVPVFEISIVPATVPYLSIPVLLKVAVEYISLITWIKPALVLEPALV